MLLTQPPSAICTTRQHGDDDQRRRASPGGSDERPRRVALGLDREQREQADAAEQVQGHDRRIEPHRHGERAERALDADPEQRRTSAQRAPMRPTGAPRRATSASAARTTTSTPIAVAA